MIVGATSIEDAVYARLAKIRAEAAEYVVTGHCADFAEYKHFTGQIRGVDLADDEMKALFKTLKESEA